MFKDDFANFVKLQKGLAAEEMITNLVTLIHSNAKDIPLDEMIKTIIEVTNEHEPKETSKELVKVDDSAVVAGVCSSSMHEVA